MIIDVWQGRYAEINRHYEILNKEIATFHQEKGKVLELVKKQFIADEEFKTEFERVKAQIASKQVELDQSRLEEFDIDRAVSYVFDFITTLPEFWERANYYQRLKLISLIFPEKPIYNYFAFSTPRLSHIFQAKTASDGGESALVAHKGIEPLFSG